MQLKGVGVSPGRVGAPLFVYLAPSRAEGSSEAGHDPAQGIRRLESAITESRRDLERVIVEASERMGHDAADIFVAQLTMLDDPEWIDPVRASIEAGRTPKEAVAAVSEEIAEEIASLPDEYLRQRASDVRDLGTRLWRHLSGKESATLASLLPGSEVIVAAHDLTPSDTVGLDPTVVRGLVTEMGGVTSHMAILARQLEIPAVVGVDGLLDAVRGASSAAIDGTAGECFLDPSADVMEQFRTAQAAQVSVPVRREPVRTRDGVAVAVYANAGSAAEVSRAVELGADGVGLYRTEFLFLGSQTVPDEETQARAYQEAAEAAAGRPIVFRTLDVGGDKAFSGVPATREDNPFLGVRGIRFCLQHRELFETQLRALLRCAANFPNVRVMIPMVAQLEEVDQVRDLVSALDSPGGRASLGVMVEVPSAVLLARELAQEVDFLSVGTNDLTQYVLAVDRTNRQLGQMYDELQPAVLRALKDIVDAADSCGKPASICGEMAGRPEVVPLLIGLGYRHFSVNPTSVPVIKEVLSATVAGQAAAELAGRALAASRLREVIDLLHEAGAPAGRL